MAIELPGSAGDPEEASDRVFPFTICSEGVTLLHSLTHNFCTFIPFLQNVQLVYQRCLRTGNRGFGSEGLKQVKVPLHGNRGFDNNRCEFLLKAIILFFLYNSVFLSL